MKEKILLSIFVAFMCLITIAYALDTQSVLGGFFEWLFSGIQVQAGTITCKCDYYGRAEAGKNCFKCSDPSKNACCISEPHWESCNKQPTETWIWPNYPCDLPPSGQQPPQGQTSCSDNSQCSQACTSLCPSNVYGCCYGCKLGQCINSQCQCVDAVSYCSGTPNYQKGSPCGGQQQTQSIDGEIVNMRVSWLDSSCNVKKIYRVYPEGDVPTIPEWKSGSDCSAGNMRINMEYKNTGSSKAYFKFKTQTQGSTQGGGQDIYTPATEVGSGQTSSHAHWIRMWPENITEYNQLLASSTQTGTYSVVQSYDFTVIKGTPTTGQQHEITCYSCKTGGGCTVNYIYVTGDVTCESRGYYSSLAACQSACTTGQQQQYVCCAFSSGGTGNYCAPGTSCGSGATLQGTYSSLAACQSACTTGQQQTDKDPCGRGDQLCYEGTGENVKYTGICITKSDFDRFDKGSFESSTCGPNRCCVLPARDETCFGLLGYCYSYDKNEDIRCRSQFGKGEQLPNEIDPTGWSSKCGEIGGEKCVLNPQGCVGLEKIVSKDGPFSGKYGRYYCVKDCGDQGGDQGGKEGDQCTNDAGCDQGYYCDNGVCHAREGRQCDNDAACGEGYYCYQNACKKREEDQCGQWNNEVKCQNENCYWCPAPTDVCVKTKNECPKLCEGIIGEDECKESGANCYWCSDSEKCVSDKDECPEPEEMTITCKECFAGTECECELDNDCDEGVWILKNLKDKPLKGTVASEIPPTEITFEPNETGEINVTVRCFDPRADSSVKLEVKSKVLDCPADCEAGKDCKCSVNNCNSGKFRVEEKEGSPLNGGSISLDVTGSGDKSFKAQNAGKVEVRLECDDPNTNDAKTTIEIKGTSQQTESFSASGFKCEEVSSKHECSIGYDNKLNEDVVIVFYFSDSTGKRVTHETDTASTGTGTALVRFDCSDVESATYRVSWTAFRSSDKDYKDPILGSTTQKSITCD